MGTAVAARNGRKPVEAKEEVEIDLSAALSIDRVKVAQMTVPIVGLKPLIVNRFSEKAKEEMLAKQTTRLRKQKELKDTEAQFQAARYRIDDKYDGFPASGFKSAIVQAARLYPKSVSMAALKSLIWVDGVVTPNGDHELVPIEHEGPPNKREDAVRLQGGVADLRYRPSYWPWSAKLSIQYVASSLDVESVLNLVNAAGIGGIGEWRPSAPKGYSGSYGRFEVSEGELWSLGA